MDLSSIEGWSVSLTETVQKCYIIGFLCNGGRMGLGRVVGCPRSPYWKNAFRNSRYSVLSSWRTQKNTLLLISENFLFFRSILSQTSIAKWLHVFILLLYVIQNSPLSADKVQDLCCNPVFFSKESGRLDSVWRNTTKPRDAENLCQGRHHISVILFLIFGPLDET